MRFIGKSAKEMILLVAGILFLQYGCAGKAEPPEPEPPSPPPQAEEFTVTICENLFAAFQAGEIPEGDIVYLDSENNIALRETDVIINQGEDSRFWVMTSLKDLVPEQNYTFRYELFTGTGELFRSESFTFSSDSSEYTALTAEELNPANRKKLSAGAWTVKIFINEALVDTRDISILSSTPGQDIVLKEYRWKDFQFQYPGYCTIEDDRDITTDDGKQFRLVKLTVSGKNRIGLFLYFSDEWTEPGNDIPQQSPAMINMMMGLPIALKHAEPSGAEAIALSVGSIELIDGFSLATRFIVKKPDADTFSSLECFHKSSAGRMFFGILFTQGFMGKGSDTPEYFRFIQDAYTIIRSISIPELIAGAAATEQ